MTRLWPGVCQEATVADKHGDDCLNHLLVYVEMGLLSSGELDAASTTKYMFGVS